MRTRERSSIHFPETKETYICEQCGYIYQAWKNKPDCPKCNQEEQP